MYKKEEEEIKAVVEGEKANHPINHFFLKMSF